MLCGFLTLLVGVALLGWLLFIEDTGVNPSIPNATYRRIVFTSAEAEWLEARKFHVEEILRASPSSEIDRRASRHAVPRRPDAA